MHPQRLKMSSSTLCGNTDVERIHLEECSAVGMAVLSVGDPDALAREAKQPERTLEAGKIYVCIRGSTDLILSQHRHVPRQIRRCKLGESYMTGIIFLLAALQEVTDSQVQHLLFVVMLELDF